ncbi:MAG TPA: aminomethyl-transferring glycine dehydrogenase subunit GcvPA, partial [Terriglobia bacterium]|nr:aminomethyl-transferring glycine dehydrogenase subunit GcvPA [Terriglobia bacterium]
MACRVTRRQKAVLSGGLHPHYRSVCETYARFNGDVLLAQDPAPSGGEELAALVDGETACVVVQNPDFYGELRDFTALGDLCHQKGALLVVVVAEILSLGAVKPPGEMGADIVAAEGQSLGNALNFGGPYLGLFASREKFVRQMPGRLVGETTDADGRRGWVLTLSTREQHIRREKATSNICTSQSLFALNATIYLCLLGKQGLRRLAEHNLAKAHYALERLRSAPGVAVPFSGPHFNEFVVRVPGEVEVLLEALRKERIIGGLNLERLYPELKNHLLVCVTETVSREALDRMVEIYRRFLARTSRSDDEAHVQATPVGQDR